MITITTSGAQPQQPSALLAQLLAIVQAEQPGYTSGLPGSLIDDVSGTQIAGLSIIDQAAVDLVNSITPWAANDLLLLQLGNIYGVQQGGTTNTSVLVTFSGSVGYKIPIGFIPGNGALDAIFKRYLRTKT